VPGHDGHSDVPTTVTLTMNDGRQLTSCVEAFMGTPARPFDREAMREKFLMLSRKQPDAERMFERLQRLEEEDSLDWLGAPAA
jgi:2-methylcitrate dehydratase PrpD